MKSPSSRDTARVKEKPPSAARVDAYNPVLEKQGQTTAQRMQRKAKGEGKTTDAEHEEQRQQREGDRAQSQQRLKARQLLMQPPDEQQKEEVRAKGEGGEKELEEGERADADTDVVESIDAQSAAVAEPVTHIHLDTAPADPRFLGQPDQSRVSALTPHHVTPSPHPLRCVSASHANALSLCLLLDGRLVSQYCWALYNTYLKCVDKKGVLDDHCHFLHKSTIAVCPTDWVANQTSGCPAPS